MSDEDEDWDDWLDMTDAEKDAALERSMNEHERWYKGLTREQQIAYHRRSALRMIRDNRRRLRTPSLCTIEYVVGLWREGVRRNQRRLLKIREWRRTGVYPGEA